MTPRQLQYLSKIHGPVIEKYKPTQRHFDLMAAYLIQCLEEHGAEVRQVFVGALKTGSTSGLGFRWTMQQLGHMTS
jgi:hypothetical protein